MPKKMSVTITWFSVEPLQHLKWFMLIICMLPAYCENPCVEIIYLEVGTEGVVSCDFEDFVLLGWINGDENHEEASPFIYLENSQVKGRGYIDGNYDMQPDGSLIIRNVQLRNEANYTALYVPSLGPQVYFTVPVKVFVRPDPEYPVINGLSEQQYIVQDVMSSGSINCTLNGTRPGVLLEWEFQSDIITMDTELPSITPYNDVTFNTVLKSRFTIISQCVTRVTVKCKAAGKHANLFPSATTIYLQLTRKSNTGPLPRPVIDGCNSQQEDCTLIVQQDGTLTCYVPNIPSKYTMNMNLDIFGDTGGISFTRIKSNRCTHMCGDYDLTTSYKCTVNEASTCAKSAIRCSLSEMNTSTLLTSSTASLIACQDTLFSSEEIHEHGSVSNQPGVIYAILFLVIVVFIELTFLTCKTTRKVGKLQRPDVKLCSLLFGSQEENAVQTELSLRNHSPHQLQVSVVVCTDNSTQLSTPLLERHNLSKESVHHSSDESGITSGTGSDTSES